MPAGLGVVVDPDPDTESDDRPGVQSIPWRAPVPGGTGWSVHVVPPSAVWAMMPMAWPTSTGWAAVAQQCVPSVHVSAVATAAWGGSAPPTTQPCEEVGDNVVTLPATTPSAVHRPGADTGRR